LLEQQKVDVSFLTLLAKRQKIDNPALMAVP
jgi:hypothetical protein